MAEEYKFPDEVEVEDKSEDFKVEIEDDTPPEDRGRAPLPKNIVEELESDDLEEYSDKVKKRLGQMKKVWHDERREKERAARERDEALRYAQHSYAENQALKQRLGQGEKVFIHEVSRAANTELATAKEKLKAAYESGDSGMIADAQEALTDAKLKLKDVESFRPSLQEPEDTVKAPSQTQAQPQSYAVDPKAEAWRQKNMWFGADEEMTALALGLHEKLVRSGVDPRSDDYYRKVDTTIRKRFPEYFEGSDTQEDRSSSRKATNVVAPATRSTAPRQVRLTSSQVALAKKLGLTPEAYARELMKLENRNG